MSSKSKHLLVHPSVFLEVHEHMHETLKGTPKKIPYFCLMANMLSDEAPDTDEIEIQVMTRAEDEHLITGMIGIAAEQDQNLRINLVGAIAGMHSNNPKLRGELEGMFETVGYKLVKLEKPVDPKKQAQQKMTSDVVRNLQEKMGEDFQVVDLGEGKIVVMPKGMKDPSLEMDFTIPFDKQTHQLGNTLVEFQKSYPTNNEQEGKAMLYISAKTSDNGEHLYTAGAVVGHVETSINSIALTMTRNEDMKSTIIEAVLRYIELNPEWIDKFKLAFTHMRK